jgi:hypothetical protein
LDLDNVRSRPENHWFKRLSSVDAQACGDRPAREAATSTGGP